MENTNKLFTQEKICSICGDKINILENNIYKGRCVSCFKSNWIEREDMKSEEEVYRCNTCGKLISEEENDDNKGTCDYCFYNKNINDGSYIGLFEYV